MIERNTLPFGVMILGEYPWMGQTSPIYTGFSQEPLHSVRGDCVRSHESCGNDKGSPCEGSRSLISSPYYQSVELTGEGI